MKISFICALSRGPGRDNLTALDGSWLNKGLSEMKEPTELRQLCKSLSPLRERLVKHAVYHRITTLENLHVFMEHHVFAVWDFMCLLKTLQNSLTCTAVPWVPRGDAVARRLVNEIVLEEESDDDGEGGYISHFELYRAAMEQSGADTSKLVSFLDRVGHGESIAAALDGADVPVAAQAFVEATWQFIKSGSVHAIAAVFTLGREDVIPDMFKALIAELQQRFPSQLSLYRYYLDRHVQLDEEHHGPMAMRMLANLCQSDITKWKEAEEAAQLALQARIAFWDGVVAQITPGT